MKTSEYETPFAKLHIYKNGHPIDFEIQPFDYGMYLNDNSFKKPEGLYIVTVDMDFLHSGDILVCEFDQGYLQDDGGGEHMPEYCRDNRQLHSWNGYYRYPRH